MPFLANERPGVAGEDFWVESHAFRGGIEVANEWGDVKRLVVQNKRDDVITGRRIGVAERPRLVHEHA